MMMMIKRYNERCLVCYEVSLAATTPHRLQLGTAPEDQPANNPVTTAHPFGSYQHFQRAPPTEHITAYSRGPTAATVCKCAFYILCADQSYQHYVTLQSIYTWENGFSCSKEMCRHYTAYSVREHQHCATLCSITRCCVQQYWRSKFQAACQLMPFLGFNVPPTAFAICNEHVSSRWLSSSFTRLSASACT